MWQWDDCANFKSKTDKKFSAKNIFYVLVIIVIAIVIVLLQIVWVTSKVLELVLGIEICIAIIIRNGFRPVKILKCCYEIPMCRVVVLVIPFMSQAWYNLVPNSLTRLPTKFTRIYRVLHDSLMNVCKSVCTHKII